MPWSDYLPAPASTAPMIGAELTCYPYISGFGLAQRIVTLALPSPSDMVRLGFRNRASMDVLLATQSRSKTRFSLLWELGLGHTTIADFWSPSAWSPVQCGRLFERHVRPVRQCPECVRHGYHNAAFQLPSLDACPWHRERLRSTCEHCGRIVFAQFQDGDRLGVCSCGISFIDPRLALTEMHSFPTGEASAWLEEFREWSCAQRAMRWIQVPEQATDWDAAFCAIAGVAQSGMGAGEGSGASGPAPMQVFDGATEDPPEGALWGWCHLGGSQTLRCAPLPASVFVLLQAVTRAVVQKVSVDGISCLEPWVHDGLTPGPAELGGATNGGSGQGWLAPYGRSAAGQVWVKLSVVDRQVTAACGALLELVACELADLPLVSDVSPQQAISCALDQVQGRSLLIAALLACLERAFSQGLTSVLRGFWGNGQPRSCIEAPCFGIVGAPGHLQSMQLVWVPIALLPPTGPKSGASDDKAVRPAKASVKRKLEAVKRRGIKAPRILK